MEEKYGFTNIERRGLIIKTTLDLEIQKMVDKIISQEINSIAKLNVSNGAAVVVGVERRNFGDGRIKGLSSKRY